MKPILLLLTGGTICSFREASSRNDVDAVKAAPILLQTFQNSDSRYCMAEFEVRSVLDTLSENMTLRKWEYLLQNLQGVFAQNAREKYQGIVILHGTDTLAYTASMLSASLGEQLPVMLVSAQYILDDPESNGPQNFRTAVELIFEGIQPGVFIPYRNSDGEMYLHRGRSAQQCRNHTWDFYSPEMVKVEEGLLQRLWEENDTNRGRYSGVISEWKGEFPKILCIQPYVGIDYSCYDLEGVQAVLHGLYHSGTACVDGETSSIIDLSKRCKKMGIPLFIAPAERDHAYVSTSKMLDSGVIPIPGMTFEMTYGKLLFGISLGKRGEELVRFLNQDLCGEHIF